MGYRCKCCGKIHEGLPDIVCPVPAYIDQIPENQREGRVRISDDFCTLDSEHFFVRGVVKIPLVDNDGYFGLGVWASQKKENFEIYLENFNSDEIGPFFGWFSNELSFKGESTLGLKTMVHFQSNNLRPLIVLSESDHPLCIAQKNGISLEEAWKFVHDRSG